MAHPLDRLSWNALSGLHSEFSAGTDTARRYAKGYSPIIGFADTDRPPFDALVPFCDPGEHFYCENWTGPAPAGWRIDYDSTKFKLVWQGALPAADEALEIVRLEAEHVPKVMELVAAASPGPFGPRTIELGEFYGWFEGPRLVAMAGERLRAGLYHEISSVCTDPDFQGRGLARRLTTKLIRQQMLRKEIPFLQVMRDNVGAHKLYERMGFSVYREAYARIVTLV